MGIGYVFNLTQKGMVAMGRIQEIFNSQPEIVPVPAAASILKEMGDIEFKEIGFSYPDEGVLSIKEIDIKIFH